LPFLVASRAGVWDLPRHRANTESVLRDLHLTRPDSDVDLDDVRFSRQPLKMRNPRGVSRQARFSRKEQPSVSVTTFSHPACFPAFFAAGLSQQQTSIHRFWPQMLEIVADHGTHPAGTSLILILCWLQGCTFKDAE
jgi:hypothetical protein